MKVLAIDPSSTVLGYAVLEDEVLVMFGTVDTSKVIYAARFQHIIDTLEIVRAALSIYEIAMERAFVQAGHNTAALQVSVQAIKEWAKSKKATLAEYSPATWKSQVVGNPFAGKEQVAVVADLLYPAKGLKGQPDHVTDAVCIGTHHQRVKRLEKMGIKQRAATPHYSKNHPRRKSADFED